MSTEVVIALIALVTAVASALVTGFFSFRVRRHDAHQREQERLDAIVARYQEPLVRAAHDLQSRLWNISCDGFLERYAEEHPAARAPFPAPTAEEHRYAVDSTAWLIAQYLGWVEILRREAQFLPVDRDRTAALVHATIDAITEAFATDRSDPLLLIFRAHQRAIGEVMVTEGRDSVGATRTDCLGYAAFTAKLQQPEFARWFDGIRRDVRLLADRTGPAQRVRQVQALLIGLVDVIDPEHTRFRGPRNSLDAGVQSQRATSSRNARVSGSTE